VDENRWLRPNNLGWLIRGANGSPNIWSDRARTQVRPMPPALSTCCQIFTVTFGVEGSRRRHDQSHSLLAGSARAALVRGLLIFASAFPWAGASAFDLFGSADRDCPPLKHSSFNGFRGYANDPSIALMQAVFRNDDAAVAMSISAGADVNRAHDQRDFVCWIASKPVTAWQAPQWTYPLFVAAQKELNPKITGLLLTAGARPDVHPFDLDPIYADRRSLVVRMPWSFYGQSQGPGNGMPEKNWAPVMAEFVRHGFVMSGRYLAGKPAGSSRDLAFGMLTPHERTSFDAEIARNETAERAAEVASRARRDEAASRVSKEIAAMDRSAATRNQAGIDALPDATGELVCRRGTLSATVCLQGTPVCERVNNTGTLYGYVEGASADRKRLQVRVGGGLLPRGSQPVSPLYRGITFDGLDYQQGQIIWGQTNEWALCDVTTAEGTLR
jgi:hypothetical protein